MRGLRRLLGGLGAAALLALASPARAETLADALASGYESSGLIEQNRALLRAADEDVAAAVAALRPVVTWIAQAAATYPQSPFATYNIGTLASLNASLQLQASLTIYDGGANRLAVDGQKESVLAARAALVDVEQRVLLRVVTAYMEVLRASAFVELRRSNVRLITEELRAAQDRFDVGEVTRTDVALAEAALAAAQSGLAAEEGGLVRAVEEFRAAVGRAPGDLATPEPATVTQSIPEAKAVAQDRHPSLMQARHQVAEAEIGVLRAEAALSPTVELTGRIGIDQDFEETASVGVQAQGSLYQGGLLASQIRRFMAQRDAARAGLLETARSIDAGVGNAYAALEVSRASQEAFATQVRAATAAFEGVREEATLGARTTLDVLDAEQDLLDARANLVSAQVDEVVASYQLLSAMGLLTAENLGLAVQLYDPTAYYDLVDDAPAQYSEQGEALERVLEAIGD